MAMFSVVGGLVLAENWQNATETNRTVVAIMTTVSCGSLSCVLDNRFPHSPFPTPTAITNIVIVAVVVVSWGWEGG